MVQLQIISHILASKDISIITNNNLTAEYFLEYEQEYNYILNHFNTYENVPDTETFLSAFPDIDLLEVNESERYLVDTIREEYLYSKVVPVIKKAAELLKSDSNESARYLQSELVNLTPNYTIPCIDILHDRSRSDSFRGRGTDSDKWFIPTGFENLDEIINGWQCGEEFVVLFARTGMGKSWLLVKFLEHSSKLGKNVGYISPEMSAEKIGYRFDTMRANYSNMALIRGNFSDINPDDYEAYLNKLSESSNKFCVSTPKDFNNKITVSKLRGYIKENKLDILGIDGITYLSDERYKRGDNKTTSLTNISEDLMQLSEELRIPILVVVQSNRGGVDKETPDLEDIRDSDGISHNATKVISINQKGGGLILQIKKHRDGKVGDKLCYLWDIDTGNFTYVESLDEHENDEDEEEFEKPKRKSKPKDNQRKVVF